MDIYLSFNHVGSRYFDPEVGRWINADGQMAGVGGDIRGYNLFSYCFNNPVNMEDSTGNWPKWAKIVVGTLAAAAVVVATVATLGAAAPAAACTLTLIGTSLGASYAVASTVATVAVTATVAASGLYAGDIAYSSITGSSPLKETVFQGNQEAYDEGLAIVSMATGGMLEMAAMSPGICFVAGTLVLTDSGHLPIEKIQVGDLVWAENPETREVALKQDVQTFVSETDELIHVIVDGEEIICTAKHPFYSPVKGWVAACDLRPRDILITVNDEYVVVEQIEREILESPVMVYNFEVEDLHTYYVTIKEILVHNTCIVKENGIKIESYYPNDHGNPAHLHVHGGGASTKIGPQGLPVAGYPSLSPQQAAVVANNLPKIKKEIRMAQKLLRSRG